MKFPFLLILLISLTLQEEALVIEKKVTTLPEQKVAEIPIIEKEKKIEEITEPENKERKLSLMNGNQLFQISPLQNNNNNFNNNPNVTNNLLNDIRNLLKTNTSNPNISQNLSSLENNQTVNEISDLINQTKKLNKKLNSKISKKRKRRTYHKKRKRKLHKKKHHKKKHHKKKHHKKKHHKKRKLHIKKIKRHMKKKHRVLFFVNKYTVGPKIRNNKFLCYDTAKTCKENECKNQCSRDPNGWYCHRCLNPCRDVYNINCKHKLNHQDKIFYNKFINNPGMCRKKKYSALKLCLTSHCQSNPNSYHPGCQTCKTTCLMAGDLICLKEIPKINRRSNKFNEIRHHFIRQQPNCSSCSNLGPRYCHRCRGNDRICREDCAKVGYEACMSVCDGHEKLTFYKKKIKTAMDDFNLYIRGSCWTCDNYCRDENHILCDPHDSFCKKEFLPQCVHQCKYKYCDTYKRNNKLGQPINSSQGFLVEKIAVYMQRLKARQMQRNEYDAIVENKSRHMALRQTRNSIIESLEMEENNIYIKNVLRHRENVRKNKEFEQKFMLKLGDALKNRKKYESLAGTIYAVFDDED